MRKRYPNYKPSGVEWLGDVPEHWEVDRLRWTTNGTINGIWGDEPNGVDDLVCVRVADFDRDRFVVVEEPPTLRAVDPAQRKGRQLVRGDLLIEKSGGGDKQLVGCVVFFDHDFDAVCSNFVARMPMSGAHCSRFWSYVHAFLYAGRLNYPAVKQTTGIQNLDSSAYLDTRVGFPPPEEQWAIADFLDAQTLRLDTLVAKKRTLIERLKEKRTALISRTVTRGLPPDAARAAGLDPHRKLKSSGIDWLGDVPEHWEVKAIFRLAVAIQTGPFGSQLHESDYVDDGIPLINPAHIVGGQLVPDDQSSVDDTTALRLSRHRLRTGDIIMGRRGEIGRCGMVTSNEEGWLCGTGALVIRLDSNDPRYFVRVFSSGGFSKLLELNAVGTTMLNLNPTIVGRMLVPVPPVFEQHAIASFLDHETAKIDRMVAKVETAIERLQEYRTALITAAVTGKIDVREALGRGERSVSRASSARMQA